jgi:uncharacterized protein involved in type VI secretion and phage assembly
LTLVRGYDRSYRLHHGRRTETYRNVKLSDVARQVAGRVRLEVGAIDDSGPTLDHVTQANLSDWEFLRACAREIDFEISVIDNRFNFCRPAASSEAPEPGDLGSTNPLQLVFGEDLLEFRPRISGAEQVREVKVRGWDPTEKRAVIGSATAGTSHAKVSTSPAELAGSFGDGTYLAHDRPLATQREVDTAARSIAEQIGSAFAEAEGTTLGNPLLRAGVPVSVARVAQPFAGSYTPTRTRHVFDEEGYRTHFEVSGRQDRSLLGLMSLGASNGSGSGGGPPMGGLAVAQVTNNDDPDKVGRVKVRFPWLSDSHETDWVRVVQLGAGPDSGAVFLPEVDDEVLCGFEFGDVRRPYVIGGLFNGKDKPRLGDGLVDAGRVKRRGFISRRGHRIVLFDDDSKSGIALLSSDGKLRLSLNETKGEIHIHCREKVTIDTESGQVTVKSGGDVDVEAQGNLTLKGQAGVKIQTSGVVEVSGQLIKLN